MSIDVYKEWLGIPETERPPNHYQLLRLVLFEDDSEKIRKHYKKLNGHVRKYATGQYATQSQELLNELAKAMLCLTDVERKLEYDRGLGREVEASADGRRSMSEVLIGSEAVTAAQWKEAASFADRAGLTLRDALVQLKLVDQETATRAMATELGRPFVDLTETYPDDDLLDQIPKSVVKHNTVLPLFTDDGQILVACANEPSHELEDEFRLRLGMPIRMVMATPHAINQGIAKYYAPGVRNEAAAAAKPKSMKSTKVAKQAAKLESQLGEMDSGQRKQIGIIMICWTIIGFAAFDYFLIRKLLPFVPDAFPFVTTLLVSPWVVLGIYKKFVAEQT